MAYHIVIVASMVTITAAVAFLFCLCSHGHTYDRHHQARHFKILGCYGCKLLYQCFDNLITERIDVLRMSDCNDLKKVMHCYDMQQVIVLLHYILRFFFFGIPILYLRVSTLSHIQLLHWQT